MGNIPTVLYGQELLDKVFRKASKVQLSHINPLFKERQEAIAKLDSVSDNVNSVLQGYVKKFPAVNMRQEELDLEFLFEDYVPRRRRYTGKRRRQSAPEEEREEYIEFTRDSEDEERLERRYQKLTHFYFRIIHGIVDLDKYKLSLGKVDGTRKLILKITKETRERIKREYDEQQVARYIRGYYGRVSSSIYRIGESLKYLNKVRDIFLHLPVIDTRSPVVVVAGYPNVGKSTLIRQLSTAKPEIASYPFTTKEIFVGITELGEDSRVQFVDTPGLFDRPLDERNDIEKASIAALDYLADMVLFIFDPTSFSGYDLVVQLSLFRNLRSLYKTPFLVAVNKLDLLQEGEEVPEMLSGKGLGLEVFGISAEDGSGVDELRTAVLKALE